MFTRFLAFASVLLLSGCISGPTVEYVNDDVLPETAVTVRQGETLMGFGFRMQEQYRFQRVLFDLSYRGSPVADRERKVSFSGVSDLSSAFMIPGLKSYQISDSGGYSLVLSDSNYETWQRLQVFDVDDSSIMKNAQRLAHLFGWQLDDANWKTDDFSTTAHPLVISDDPQQAFEKLLNLYPATADLNPNNKTIQVNERLHAKH